MQTTDLEKMSNIKLSKLPKIKLKRNVLATKNDEGSIILAIEGVKSEEGYHYFISLDENHPVFDLLTKDNTLTLTKGQLTEKYRINFIDFNTIPS